MNNDNLVVLSIRIPQSLKDDIDALAKSTSRRKSDLLIKWISEKVETEKWQLEKIEAGLKDIDKGEVKRIPDIREYLSKRVK